MDELLPVLTARVRDRQEAVPVVEAALKNGVAYLVLDDAPETTGPHALDLHVPGMADPLLFVAEPVGVAREGRFPLLLRPFASFQEGNLLAFLASERELSDDGFASTPPSVRAADVDAAFDAAIEEPLAEADLVPSDAPAPFATSASQSGDQLIGRAIGGGKYLVEALLGSGGMGSVYRGRHLALQKAIAIKVLHPSYQHDAKFMASFHREALAASRLDHPNVVGVYDFGQEPDGMLYIVMELLKGRDLRSVLTESPIQPLLRIVDIMSQVCAALAAAHDQDVVHRDVKPDNILLCQGRDDDGTIREIIKVCDFGIAEIRGGGEESVGGGTVSGTPDYISPEQARAEALDARSDLYACGVVLYEMAVGRVPFASAQTAVDIVNMHLTTEPQAPSGVNPHIDRKLEAVILKAMSKDKARRQQSARELRADLRAIVEVAPVNSQRPDTPVPHRPSTSKGNIKSPTIDDEDEIFDAPDSTADPLRTDAIDVDDFIDEKKRMTVAPPKPREQAWILGERVATALATDPEPKLAELDRITDPMLYGREMPVIERAMVGLVQRGAAGPLMATMARLGIHARGAEPDEKTREGLAAKAFRTVARPESLTTFADQVLIGPPQGRDAARKLLVLIGTPGAIALFEARERATNYGKGPADPVFTAGGRPRFVAALREIGAPAIGPLITALDQVNTADPVLMEDLLRAVPDVPDERIGGSVTRFLRMDAPTVRRAAVAAVASSLGPRGNGSLSPLVDDADDAVRMAALGALRRGGGVDREVVKRIERLLNPTVPASDDLRAAAAAALVDTTGPARASAVEVLTAALRPPEKKSFFTKLVTVEATVSDMLILTMARVLLAIGGKDAARIVDARAQKSAGELRKQLLDVVAASPR